MIERLGTACDEYSAQSAFYFLPVKMRCHYASLPCSFFVSSLMMVHFTIGPPDASFNPNELHDGFMYSAPVDVLQDPSPSSSFLRHTFRACLSQQFNRVLDIALFPFNFKSVSHIFLIYICNSSPNDSFIKKCIMYCIINHLLHFTDKLIPVSSTFKS